MKLTAWLMTRAQSLNRERNWGEIALILLDDAGIARANAAVFGQRKPTDTISLAYAPLPGPDPRWRAEILVNVERARQEGARRSGGAERELALYIAHGCQHLADRDDAAPADRRRMRRLETAWLRAAAAQDLLTGIRIPGG